MPRKGDKYHGEHDSPFFRLRSRAKLASLLFSSRPKLESLARERGLYYQFPMSKPSGGVRIIIELSRVPRREEMDPGNWTVR